MVKHEDIESKMKGYADENKLSALEALYMWSKGISSKTIAGVLNNKYGSVEALDIITKDLSSLQIRSPSERVELTDEEVGFVIRDSFNKHKQPILDKMTEDLGTLTVLEKNVLLAMIRSSLFEMERIKPEDLKIAYRAILGETMKDRDFEKALLYLEKIGIIYCDRTYGRIEAIIIPEHIYPIESQIKAKLPKVIISEEKEQS
jgi:hypothetical protein